MVLVTYKGNWADEMDLFGYCIYPEEKDFQEDVVDWLNDQGYEYKTFNEILEDDSDEEFSFYCGSNEEVCYDSVRDFIDAFTVEEISADEAETIQKRLGNSEGNYPL